MFLRRPQAVLVQLVQGLHFENHSSGQLNQIILASQLPRQDLKSQAVSQSKIFWAGPAHWTFAYSLRLHQGYRDPHRDQDLPSLPCSKTTSLRFVLGQSHLSPVLAEAEKGCGLVGQMAEAMVLAVST